MFANGTQFSVRVFGEPLQYLVPQKLSGSHLDGFIGQAEPWRGHYEHEPETREALDLVFYDHVSRN